MADRRRLLRHRLAIDRDDPFALLSRDTDRIEWGIAAHVPGVAAYEMGDTESLAVPGEIGRELTKRKRRWLPVIAQHLVCM